MSRRNSNQPLYVVCAVAAIVSGSLLLIRYLTPEKVEARVTISSREMEGEDDTPNAQTPLVNVFASPLVNSPEYRTADRVREASALTLVIGLVRIKGEAKGRVPGDVESLIKSLAAESLIPPGIAITSQPGLLRSDLSSIYVRYRVSPFGVEVVSIPRGQHLGNSLLMRLPSDPSDPLPTKVEQEQRLDHLIEGAPNAKGGYMALFSSTQNTRVVIPDAFAPAAVMYEHGWTREPSPQAGNDAVKVKNEITVWLKTKEEKGEISR